MEKNALREIGGTIAQGAIIIGGVAIIIGSLPVPHGHIVGHSIAHGMPHVIDDIEKWKHEKTK